MVEVVVINAVQSFLDSMFEGTYTTVAFIILVALFIQYFIRWLIDRVVHKIIDHHTLKSTLDAKKRKQTLSAMFKTASAVFIWICAIVLILVQLDVNLAGLATGAGLIGIVVGFGAQNSIKDILAGIFIIAENQYRIGDIVSLYAAGKDVAGVVEDLSVRITRLRDLDGNTHIIPNGSISIMTNLSFHFANVNVDIDVAYETDIDEAERVINQVGEELAEDENWQKHIYEPIKFLRVDSFEDSSVRIKALGKVEPAQQWDVAGEFRRRIKKAFEAAGIEIPFNQIVIHESKTKPQKVTNKK